MNKSSSIGYADCFSGISGDMFLGALISCGLPLSFLQDELSKLRLSGYSLTTETRMINGIGSIKLDIEQHEKQSFRHLSSISEIISSSDLDQQVKERSVSVFKELARAEAKVHEIDIEQVHFHEVGALDTIIDVVGTVIGLRYLGIDRLVASPLPMPRGFINCDHGQLPLPAPAVCEILQDVPCYGVDLQQELVTPTGAALLKVLADDWGQLPPMVVSSTGYGAGSSSLASGQPNLFRLIIGEPAEVAEHQMVEIIESNLDDWNTEGFPHLCESLLEAGALDVSLTPILMKKGRPGFCLQVITSAAFSHQLQEIIFNETSAIGLRTRREERQTLPRTTIVVNTIWGEIKAKKVRTPDGEMIYPEYEECRRIAKEHNVSLKRVYQAVLKAEEESS